MPTEIPLAGDTRRIDQRAGRLPLAVELVDTTKLIDAYYALRPDSAVPAQRVVFGTSGHRGSSFARTFNETHVLAITQASTWYDVSYNRILLVELLRRSQGVGTEWRGFLVDVDMSTEAQHADLTILEQSQPESLPVGTPPDVPEYVALSSGRPVLVVPHIGAPKLPGKRVMLCWNGSREATLAVERAWPLLESATDVTVLTVNPKVGTDHRESAERIAEWLGRHGIKTTVRRDSVAQSDVGAQILLRAADLDIDLIVMGIYGHSRLREFVLGGVSRTMLFSMTVPLLIAH